MLIDNLERAKAEPSKDYHLAYQLRSIFRRIRDGEVQEDVLGSELSEFEQNHPLIDTIEPLQQWVEHREYEEGGKKAMALLQDAYEDSQRRGWQNVSVLCLQQLALLRKETGGTDLEKTIEKAVEFIEQDFNGNDVHLGNFHTLVDLVVENCGDLDQDIIQRCIDECKLRREIQHRNNQYQNERSTLEKIIQLKRELDQEVDVEQGRLVDSFENEVSRPSSNSI